MTIEDKGTYAVLIADAGKAIRLKSSTEPSYIVRATIMRVSDVANWEDCAYGEGGTAIKYSKLKLYAAITALPDVNSATAWNALQTWLNGKTIEGLNGWMAFSLAQEISNAHPLFEALYAEALTVLGLTREQGDALLAQCVLD